MPEARILDAGILDPGSRILFPSVMLLPGSSMLDPGCSILDLGYTRWALLFVNLTSSMCFEY